MTGIEIEGGEDAVDVQYPWESSPHRHHNYTMIIQTFFLDQYPVTNQQFKQFMDSTQYQPKDKQSFLRDWKNGTFPSGWEKKPVVQYSH